MKKRERKDRPDLVPEIFAQQPSLTDPQGSWTGRPMNEFDVPVQDADDLYPAKTALRPVLHDRGR